MDAASAPESFRYVRILVLVQLTRFFGLVLFSGIQRGLIPQSAALFGVGDALVAATAIPIWYGLGRGRLTTYLLAMAWVTFGLVDLVYAVIDGALSGQLGGLSTLFGPGLAAIPFNLVIQLTTFGLLFTSSFRLYRTRT